MWIFDLLQILVVSLTKLVECLIFLIDWNTFTKNTLLIKSWRFGSEIVDKQLQNDRNTDISHLVVLQLIHLLCYQCFYRQLKLCLFFSLLLTHVLSLEIYPVVDKRLSFFEGFWKLWTYLLGYECYEIFCWDFQILEQFWARVYCLVSVFEEAIERAKSDIIKGFNVKVGFDQDKLL